MKNINAENVQIIKPDKDMIELLKTIVAMNKQIVDAICCPAMIINSDSK